MDAVVYARISQDRAGAGLGVERQESDCRALAEQLGWNVTHVFVDNDVSAYGSKPRPQYLAMLKAFESGKYQGLLSWHVDRLYRSIPDLSKLVEVCDANKVEIRTVKAGKIDLSTSAGRLNATMFASIARYEVERSAERIKSAKQQQALDGKFRGGPRPFAYKEGGMELEPTEADALRDAAEQFLRGVSLMSISRQWMDAGIKTARGTEKWTVTALRKVLTRARNAGLVEQGDKIVGPALWPAVFDAETLHAVRAVIADPSRRVSTSYERVHQGAGIYRCGKCGEPMKVFTMRGGGDTSYKSYRCAAKPHLSQRKEPLDDFIDQVVVARLSRADAELILDHGHGVDVVALQMERDGLQARKKELVTLFASGDIDGVQLKAGSAHLQAKIDRLDAQLSSARQSSPLADLVLSGDDLRAVWEGLSADVRGKVIGQLMSVTILPVGSGQRPKGGGLDMERVKIDWKV
ncbi:recombinase family protein [Rhodococcus sp. JVH1]|uniref:recombinase family protein n=1 Tax=Rhodococcus sp. JVH1 TaxID=745408 RepID=UPI0002721CFB|nr:recombinase family protein [Rhodococcus sp. JVH1]EJI96927.1 resolvase, N terminal domain protein [Rhodococcus sp. JVH1]